MDHVNAGEQNCKVTASENGDKVVLEVEHGATSVLQTFAHPVHVGNRQDLARELQLLQQALMECQKRVQGIVEPFLKEIGREQQDTALSSNVDAMNEAAILRTHEEHPKLSVIVKKPAPNTDDVRQDTWHKPSSMLVSSLNVPPQDAVAAVAKTREAHAASHHHVGFEPPTSSIASVSALKVRGSAHACATPFRTSHVAATLPVAAESTFKGVETDQSCRGSVSKFASGRSLSNLAHHDSRNKRSVVADLTKYWDMLSKSDEERRLEIFKRQTCHTSVGQMSGRSSNYIDGVVPNGWEDHTTEMAKEPQRSCMQRIVQHSLFEMCFGIIIVTNSIYIGVEVDFVAKHPTMELPIAYQLLGYVYTSVFFIELMMRLIADYRGLLCAANFQQMCWNYLDILIVVSSLGEVVLDVIKALISTGDGEGVNLSNLRIIRIIRITKLMRLFRIGRIIKFIRALRVLIMSILYTLKSVVWSLLLLTIIMYVFAIVFTQACSDYFVEIQVHGKDPTMPIQDANDLSYHWGSLATSMLALFMSITGGISWVEVAKPLRSIDTAWLIIFALYISFVYFAVLNVVTGIFCQSAIESTQNDQDAMLHSFLQNKEMYTDRFKALFNTIDADGSGQLTKEEFEEHVGQEDVQAYFAVLGIDSEDAITLFSLLDDDDYDQSTSIGIDAEDFVHGCLRLKGFAKSVDLAKLLHEHRHLGREFSAMKHLVKEQHELLENIKYSIPPSMHGAGAGTVQTR